VKLQNALAQGRVVGESQNFTRELVNEPGNRLTPTNAGDRAKKMCESFALSARPWGPDKIKELKMGAFWRDVAQRAPTKKPRLIVITMNRRRAEKPVLGLVGKGITFDPAASPSSRPSMEKMKYDMAGGAA